MKTSELIEKLQANLEIYGDLDVFIHIGGATTRNPYLEVKEGHTSGFYQFLPNDRYGPYRESVVQSSVPDDTRLALFLAS